MIDPHLLRAVADELEAALDMLPPPSDFYLGSWIDAHARHGAELKRRVIDPFTRDRGLVVTKSTHVNRVRLHKVSATSTGGVASALRNWCIAARRRAAELA